MLSPWKDDLVFSVHRFSAPNVSGLEMVYLAGSHVNHDPWNPNAVLQVLCQACHCTFDAQHHAAVRKANTAKRKARAEARKRTKA